MKAKIIFLTFLIYLLYSCKDITTIDDAKSLDCSEVKKLLTKEQKQEFLVAIWDRDQSVRNNENKTYRGKSMNEIDALNLKKIECYLKNFKYPDTSWGLKSNLAPWVVIHHSTNNARRRNFNYLRKAYNGGNLEVGHFVFYLDRLHSIEKGKRFDMGSSYREEDRVEQLIKILNLE